MRTPAGAERPRRVSHARPAVSRARSALLVTAAVVAATIAACSGNGTDLPAVEGPTSPRVEIRATEMSFEPNAIAVQAGDVEVVLHNDGTTLHDLHVADQPFIVEAAAGQTATAHIALEPGRYELFCALPGHRQAGMKGVLEVRSGH